MGFLDDLFGTDEKTKYDDGNYWGPIHATDERGNDVAVSFGKSVDEGASTDRSGETLICDGHVTITSCPMDLPLATTVIEAPTQATGTAKTLYGAQY